MNAPAISYNTDATPEIWMDSSERFNAGLVRGVVNPVANIKLAIEMLGSEIKDEDLNIYLDIIMRSVNRINHLIDKGGR